MNVTQRLGIYLNKQFTKKQVRDLDALRYYLNASADAESNGEATVFERVKPFLDGKYAKLVERHASDEVGHAAMFIAHLESLGGKVEPVPQSLKIVERLGVAADDILQRELETPADAAKAYLLLYAVERRAIERFALIQDALEEVHPAIAASIATIATDEHRHLLYCVAVSRALVPDEAEWTRMRDEMVALEEEVFTEYSREFQWHLLDEVFTTMPWYQRVLWKAARTLADWTGTKQAVLPIGGADSLPSGRMPASLALAA